MIDTIVFYILILVSLTDLRPRSQKPKKTTISAPKSLQFSIECDILFRLADVMNIILISSCLYNIQDRKPYLCGVLFLNVIFGLYSDIYNSISFKLSMMIEITKVYYSYHFR